MQKKFEILFYDTVHNSVGARVFRIRALRDFGDVRKGELGGYVQYESNLSHDGNCWIDGKSTVYGNARVMGDARVKNSVLRGFAKIDGDTLITDCELFNYINVVDSDISRSEMGSAFPGNLSVFSSTIRDTVIRDKEDNNWHFNFCGVRGTDDLFKHFPENFI